MEYAERLPRLPTRKAMIAPVVALLVGAGAATGAYALIDDGNSPAQAAKVIVVEQPGPNAADIPGKNEASTAAAISDSGGIELRGSKASSTGTSSPLVSRGADRASELRSDPHGPAISLRSP
jgi:hypothetical protein